MGLLDRVKNAQQQAAGAMAGAGGIGGMTGGGDMQAQMAAAQLANKLCAQGSEAELDLLERCLTDDQPAAVVFVHGPGGIGKSTLLRELERRASGSGWDTFLVEGRELSPAPDALEATLEGARASSRPLILIDT